MIGRLLAAALTVIGGTVIVGIIAFTFGMLAYLLLQAAILSWDQDPRLVTIAVFVVLAIAATVTIVLMVSTMRERRKRAREKELARRGRVISELRKVSSYGKVDLEHVERVLRDLKP